MKKFATLMLCLGIISSFCGSLQAADPNARDNRQRTALMVAVIKKDLPRVKELLSQGADVNLVDKDSNTALYYAAELRKDAAGFVKVLLEAGADPNQACRWKQTPLGRTEDPAVIGLLASKGADLNAPIDQYQTIALIEAAEQGREDLVKALLENGANIEATNKYKETALLVIAEEGKKLSMAELLIKYGANINAFDKHGRTPLCLTVDDSSKRPMTELLLSKGAGVDARRSDQSWTPLAWALRKYEPSMAKLMIDHGADPNLAVDGNYPIMFALAIDDESMELSKLLIEKGARLDVKTSRDETPFMVRAGKKNATPEQLQWLISKGADPKGADSDGHSALIFSAGRAGNLETLKYLLSLGIYDINASDEEGNTPILLFQRKNAEDLQQLIDLGCDPHRLNKKGSGLMQQVAVSLSEAARHKADKKAETAAEGAAEWEKALAEFYVLLRSKVSINSKNQKGWTPLMWSVRMLAPLEVVKLMVEAGADPKVTTPEGESALSLAQKWCKPEVAEYLKSLQ